MRQNPFEVGKIYHVYNRGNNREDIFIEQNHQVGAYRGIPDGEK